MHEEPDLEKAIPVDQTTVDTNMADTETKVHTSEQLTLLQRQIPPRWGEERSKALVYLTLTMTERKAPCEPRRSERETPCETGGQKGEHRASYGGDGEDCGERNDKEGCNELL